MKAIATKVSYLGNHISHSLGSIPRPHFNGHLVKDALKSAKNGLANAAGRVVRACRPDETVAPPAFNAGDSEATERRVHFEGQAASASEFPSDDFKLVKASIKHLMSELDPFISVASNGNPGTPMWTYAVETIVANLGQLSDAIKQKRNECLSNGNSYPEFAHWLDTQLTDLRAEQKAWQAKLDAAR